MKLAFLLPVAFLLTMQIAYASLNITYLNVTVMPEINGSAYVEEVYTLYASGPSVNQYNSYRQAINLTISNWQQALGTSELTEHIINPVSSIYNFEFLPGPLQYQAATSGQAQILMSYYVRNVTYINETAPRKFEYTFNNAVMNFMHTASGQALPENSRLNIITPKGAKIVSIYPLPDYPQTGFISNYTGKTEFSWFNQEPLGKFAFSYTITQSLGSEVTSYFSSIYHTYAIAITLFAAIVIIAIIAYLYIKVARVKV